MQLQLSPQDNQMLAGEAGTAVQMAMRILVRMAHLYGATHLLDVSSAHIDGCLYHGQSGIDFAERLANQGAHVRIPTTLNVGGIDLLHPQQFQGSADNAEHASRLMALYQQMGCQPTWTCTPYQTLHRPPFGSQIAWAESNAIVFANSVLGARTNRYGDFIDICMAITGRAPAVGLHLTENRRGQLLFNLVDIPPKLLAEDAFFPLLGYYLGGQSAGKIPVINGLLPSTSEDQLKALGAAAASSGAVALFHAVGITPEAPTVEAALQEQPPEHTYTICWADLRPTLAQLQTAAAHGRVDVVALGSPHFSIGEFAALLPLLAQYPIHPDVEFIVCTNRLVLAALQQRGWLSQLQQTTVRLVVDTCIVVAPIVYHSGGTLMTNSGKFAHYAPGNIGFDVLFGSLEECVRTAHHGRLWRDTQLWGDTA